MEAAIQEWLLMCAETLHVQFSGNGRPINLDALLKSLKIELLFKVDPVVKKSFGRLLYSAQEGYKIQLVGAKKGESARTLSPRERFTIGHELAHYFLIEKFSLNPQEGRRYREVEDICDDFSARLLVPSNVADFTNARSSFGWFSAVKKLACTFDVTVQVIARTLATKKSSIGFFVGTQARNTAGKSVLRARWVASQPEVFSFKDYKHLLPEESKLAALVLENWLAFSSIEGYGEIVDGVSIYGKRIYRTIEDVLFVGMLEKTPSLF